MAFNINDMRSQLVTGGARPTLFQVRLQNPANSAGDVKFPFMCTATQIPASTVGTIPVLYFGREVKFAGDRTFEPWNVQVLNDEDFLIRNAQKNGQVTLINMKVISENMMLHCSISLLHR